MSDLEKKRVMCVDDDETTIFLLETTLAPFYEVITFTSPFQFLVEVEKDGADLIVLDGIMPYLDGMAVRDIIREMPHIKSVPIIFFTTLDKTYQEVLLLQGSHYWVEKGEYKELLNRIKTILSEP
jgi:DNA-binding response OmpR family regulator